VRRQQLLFEGEGESMLKQRWVGASAALVSLMVVLAACGTGASPGASTAGSQAPVSTLKIGLVTDVGTLDDHNFNQYSWEGAVKGATDIGAPAPKNIVTTQSADYAKNIQSFVDQNFNVIVTVGFAIGADTTKAAKDNPNIKFVGVDQSPCVDESGNNDPNFGCKGDASKLLPNYQGIQWKEQEPGYLAGIVAASISKNGEIAAIGGTYSVPAVPNYMIGYRNGALSVNPNIVVDLSYVSDKPDTAAFNDPSGGKAWAQQLMQQHPKIDVMFQVAGKTGNGVLQAACDAGIKAIGVDVDQHLSTPESAACIVTSAEKFLTKNVADALKRIAAGTDKGGTVKLSIATDDVGLAPFYDFQSLITADTQAKLDAATAALKDGSLQGCDANTFGACKVDAKGMPLP
jgi:basic membrane protein A and related proteins